MENESASPAASPASAPDAQPDLADLQAQCRALRHQLQTMLLLLVVVSGTLTLFLFRQYRTINGELKSAKHMIGQYTGNAPLMDDFVRKLAEYGRTHSDFVPVLTKYGINPNNVPAVTPAPAPAAKPLTTAPAAKPPAAAPAATPATKK